MIDARNYRVEDKLKNGAVVTIRAIRPDDRNRIVEAFGHLERETIYSRFFRYKSQLTDEELRAFTEADFKNVVALVVTIPAGGEDETVIGSGSYVLYGPSDAQGRAEVAFTVEEDYQGQGIASRILKHLVDIAREQGVLRFEAEVLAENRAMLTVFAHSGLPMKTSLEEGVVYVSLSLQAQAS
ncbi:GNAT family N-acetyltransferase [Syntrophobacter fumaroxidans]|nr:GNAT family N-acetyltransferase [Syntrophobacter fumaroxidans]